MPHLAKGGAGAYLKGMAGISERKPDSALAALLPDADFADAFALAIAGKLNANEAAQRAFGRVPAWVSWLMALRNRLVRPFGLKTAVDDNLRVARIGYFPVVEANESRVVLGFPDRHLDFRVVVVAESLHEGTLVTATTLVRTHNRFGRVYLAFVRPFHRVIVPAMLRQVKKSDAISRGSA